MADDLLPCPFCGGKAERVDIDEGENAGGSCICCTSCMASGNVEFGFKENFVSNWNRRARLSSPPGEDKVEAVARALFDEDCDVRSAPWAEQYDAVRRRYRRLARAALTALPPTAAEVMDGWAKIDGGTKGKRLTYKALIQ